MKIIKAIASAVCVFGILLTCGSCIKLTKLEEKTVETDIPPKIAFIGDSIAAGYGLDGYSADDLYNCRSYANILSDKYKSELDGKCEQVMMNGAVTGDNSSQLLGHLEDGSLDSVLTDSDAVVISIGANDLLDVIHDIMRKLGYDIDEHSFDIENVDIISAIISFGGISSDIDTALVRYEENLGRIIDEIRKRTSGEIFIQTVYDPFAYFDISLITSFTSGKAEKLNKVIEKNADYGGTHFYTVVDVAKVFDGKSGELTNIKSLDIHPSEKGHEEISRVVDEAVRTHTYTYTTSEEVTDTNAVIMLIWISVFAVVIVIAAVILIIHAIKRKKL